LTALPPGASEVRRVGGGHINEAYRVRMPDGAWAFVKTRAGAVPGEYAAEAAGLRWLAAPSSRGEPGALRTPRVLEVHHRYLALEWLDARAGALDRAGAEELGRGLARMHLAGAPCFGLPAAGAGASGGGAAGGAGEAGAEEAARTGARSGQGPAPARFGPIELPNEPAADWPRFYASRRLLPLARAAERRGALTPAGRGAIERVCERLEQLCGPPEPPARVHGDLWSGNVLVDQDGRPWLIDPSAYGAHREIDLAMLRLFGAPCERVFDAYEELAPLAAGWRERVQLNQLLALLLHAALFGGAYGQSAERAAARYL